MDKKKARKNKKRKVVLIPPSNKAEKQLSRDEVRSINKKKMSKRRKMKNNLMTLLLALIVLCIGTILVFSLFFKVNTVAVNGENIYSDKMIAEKSGIEIGTNLFRVNEEKVSQKLAKSLPYIKSVTFERKLPDTLVINVESTREVAAFVSNSMYVLVDETGKVIDKDASVLRENVAVINNVRLKEYTEGECIVLTNEKKTEVLITLLGALNKAGIDLLTEIDLKNTDDIKIKYDDRITIELGDLTNVETKLARGKVALERENEISAYSKGTLDLKTDPYVYFKSGTEANKKNNSKK